MARSTPIVGVLLAGGLSRRMGGGDKNQLQLGGKLILDRLIDRVKPQVSTLILNANGDAERFSKYDLPVVGDVIDGFAGPLAGVLTGLEWASEHEPACEWVATFATDAPFVPEDMVAKLLHAIVGENADMACAMSNGRTHPPFALWPVRLKDDLHRAMVDEDMRKIDLWTARYQIVHVPFENPDLDPFFNINKPENLSEAERFLEQAIQKGVV